MTECRDFVMQISYITFYICCLSVSPIMEASPMTEPPTDSISQMCQQVTHGLSALTSDDPFLVVPSVAQLGTGSSAGGGGGGGRALSASGSQTNTPRHSTVVNASSGGSSAAAAPISGEFSVD